MNAHTPIVKAASTAPLKNVSAMMALVEKLVSRPQSSSGFGVFSGPSGYGKTVAAKYAQNSRRRCLYIEVRSYWNKRTFCEAVLAELSAEKPRGTIATMMEEIARRLGDDPGRVLIVDEADVLVDRRIIELARDVQEMTAAPVILVGEEMLPTKLKAHERIDGRVFDWVLAEPCDLDDCRTLASIVLPKLRVADDLLDSIRRRTDGKTRRIVNTLHEVETFARNTGASELTLDGYKGRVFTGEAPSRRGRPA